MIRNSISMIADEEVEVSFEISRTTQVFVSVLYVYGV